MPGDVPDCDLNISENGAWCFGSIPKTASAVSNWKITTLNVRNGTIKPHGDTELTARLPCKDQWLADPPHRPSDPARCGRYSARCRLSEQHDAMGAVQGVR